MLTNNKLFYDEISGFYDDMINSDKIIRSKQALFKKILPEWMKTAADVGCGSGNDSIALTLNGLNVTGFDPSVNMIKTAEINAKNRGLKITFEPKGASKIGEKYHNSFDAVLSLGNAIPNIKPVELKATFKKIHSILNVNGGFIAQILNYDNVLRGKKRIVNITKSKDKIFVRFYDFSRNSLFFNILEFDQNNLNERKLHSTNLFPYQKDYLTSLMKKAGFRSIKCYGDFNFNRFSKNTSKDLIFTAKK
jgi:glycine/sarcosine N-methyltransferase